MTKWQTKKIRNLGRVVTGKTPPKIEPHYFDGDELFVSPKDLDRDQLYVTETETRVSSKALDKFRNQVIPKNSVMFTSLSFGFGKMGIASRAMLTNQQINSVVVNKENNFRFVYYLLKACTPFIFAYNSGIDTPIVPKSVFERIELRCPEFRLQSKIAAVLWAYDELIQNNKRRIALLERLAEEIYREWFVRFRFPIHEKTKFIKGVPEGWIIDRIDSIGKVVTGKTPSTSISRYYGEPYLFIKTPDMHGNMFVLETEENLSRDGLNSQPSQTIPEGSICVSCIGTGDAGSSSADNYFEELVRFTRDLKEESERHIREGLAEDELELFDLLKTDKMTKEETQKVRLAAKSLLHRLREEKPKVLVQDWFKDSQTKRKVQSTVEEVLHSHLPDSYDRVLFKEKCDNVFDLMLNYAFQGVKWAA
jgi:restriction endonuclease S subunit